ncbi:hypothetical protein DITRI_Ditri17bG0118000 [Diplodiscus trichospermus]
MSKTIGEMQEHKPTKASACTSNHVWSRHQRLCFKQTLSFLCKRKSWKPYLRLDPLPTHSEPHNSHLQHHDQSFLSQSYDFWVWQMGDIDNARLLFDEAPVKDRGIWAAMIFGYVKNNCFKEGLYMFRLMQMSGTEPDEAILVSILCACGDLGALDTGIWIHKYLDQQKFPLTLRLSTSLVDMYARCGNLDMAMKLFDEMQQRDVVSWNVMISGMAMHGNGESALKLFRKNGEGWSQA